MFPLHEGHGHGGVAAGFGTEMVVAAGLGVLFLVFVTGYLLAADGDRSDRDGS
jgi:hypothetical protein